MLWICHTQVAVTLPAMNGWRWHSRQVMCFGLYGEKSLEVQPRKSKSVPGITSHQCLHICISAEAQLSFSLFFNLISWKKLHYWPCNLSLWWWALYSPAPWIGTALFSGWQYNVQLHICVTAGIKSLNLLCEMYGRYNTGNDGNKIRKRTKEKAIMHLLALNINWLTVVPLKEKKKGGLAKKGEKSVPWNIQ